MGTQLQLLTTRSERPRGGGYLPGQQGSRLAAAAASLVRSKVMKRAKVGIVEICFLQFEPRYLNKDSRCLGVSVFVRLGVCSASPK